MSGCGVGREMEDGRGELMDGSKGKGKEKVGIKNKKKKARCTTTAQPTNQPPSSHLLRITVIRDGSRKANGAFWLFIFIFIFIFGVLRVQSRGVGGYAQIRCRQ